MSKIIDYLHQLDLSETEGQIYLSLLKTGPLSVREIAKIVGVKRTSVYMYIDRLMEKSLIIKQVKGSRTQIAANKPKETLKSLVEQKVKNDKAMQQALPDVVKAIEETIKQSSPNEEAEIKYYKGRHGVKKVYEEVLRANEVRSYVSIEEIAKVFPENFTLFDNAYKKNTSIKMYEIVEDSEEARKRFWPSIRRRKYLFKFLPKGVKLAAQDILIYDGKVAMIQFKGNVNGIIMRNEALYANFKILFDYIWQTLPQWK